MDIGRFWSTTRSSPERDYNLVVVNAKYSRISPLCAKSGGTIVTPDFRLNWSKANWNCVVFYLVGQTYNRVLHLYIKIKAVPIFGLISVPLLSITFLFSSPPGDIIGSSPVQQYALFHGVLEDNEAKGVQRVRVYLLAVRIGVVCLCGSLAAFRNTLSKGW